MQSMGCGSGAGERMKQGRTSRVAVKSWRLVRAGPQRQILVAEAVASLATARLLLATRPFSDVAARLGNFSARADDAPQTGEQRSARHERIAREVGWAVRAAAPWMPFRALCLQQAIAARAMLRRRGIVSVLHLGAGPDDSRDLTAHAWLDAAGAKVTGYPVAPHIVEIGCFS